MYIEDLIHRLANDGPYLFLGNNIQLFKIDEGIIFSLSNQLTIGHSFTQKQATLAVRLCKKYERQLCFSLGKDITSYIDFPKFKLTLRTISTDKSVTIRKVPETNKRVISVAFPYDDTMVTNIRVYKKLISNKYSASSTVNFNHNNKTWDFDLREEHISWINQNIVDSTFIVDETFQDFINQAQDIKNNLEKYVPMVVFEENTFKFKNIPGNIPQPTSPDVVDVLVEARKYGIHVWSETIDAVLSKIDINPFLLKFLSSPELVALPEQNEKLTMEDIISIVKFSIPCLVVIPGGSEKKHLEVCNHIFQKNGISKEEMSVLFRLNNETGQDCNLFIKENKLNNPVTEKTKIVFISGKVPKPLIEQKVNFSAILNFGISGVHYTLSNYLRNHHFVINYTLKQADHAFM